VLAASKANTTVIHNRSAERRDARCSWALPSLAMEVHASKMAASTLSRNSATSGLKLSGNRASRSSTLLTSSSSFLDFVIQDSVNRLHPSARRFLA
jgi:hypothetical protein